MEEESNEGKSDNDMTESSGDGSGVVTIGEDTSSEEELIPEEALPDDEVPIKSKYKHPEKEKADEDDLDVCSPNSGIDRMSKPQTSAITGRHNHQ